MKWLKISEHSINEDLITFLTNGKTVFIKGSKLNPFFLQLCGEYTRIIDFKPTHYLTLPDLSDFKLDEKFS